MVKIVIEEKPKDKGLFFGGYIEIDNKKTSIGSNHKTIKSTIKESLKILIKLNYGK